MFYVATAVPIDGLESCFPLIDVIEKRPKLVNINRAFLITIKHLYNDRNVRVFSRLRNVRRLCTSKSVHSGSNFQLKY